MRRTDTWTVRRSRLPALLAAALLLANGISSAAAHGGFLFWLGVVATMVGATILARSSWRQPETLRIICQERLLLEVPHNGTSSSETSVGRVAAQGLVHDSSVIMSWLIVLRVFGDDGRHQANVVLDPWSAPADELRRLRVRLLTDESIRA